MAKNTRYVGLDVHARSIAVAAAEAGRNGEVRSLGVVPNRPEDVRKLVKKLAALKSLRVCYEAGPAATSCTGSSWGWGSPAKWWLRPWCR